MDERQKKQNNRDNNFEIDKILGAVIIALFTILISYNVGSILYSTETFSTKRGYRIEIPDSIAAGAEIAKGIPDVLDLKAIFKEYDIMAGQNIFKKCAICHTAGKGEANKVGPNLWGILNAKVAHRPDFSYSSAMVAKGAKGDVWTYEELYRYLYAPKSYVIGTKMAFAGIKNDQDRVNLIMYLHSLADTPVAAP